MDAGQTITLLLTTDASLKGSLKLSKGSATVSTATASVVGADVVIQTVRVAGQLGDSTPPTNYTITVGGATRPPGPTRWELSSTPPWRANQQAGRPTTRRLRRKNINNSFVTLHSAGNSATQPARAAVVGDVSASAQATVPNSLETNDTWWGNAYPFVLQPFGYSSMRYQQIYPAAQLNGGTIDEIRFRRGAWIGEIPDFAVDLTVHMGYSTQPFTSARHGSTTTLVAA